MSHDNFVEKAFKLLLIFVVYAAYAPNNGI